LSYLSTHAADNISETVFERMLRRRNRFRDTPYGHLCKCIASKDNATANEREGLHAGDYDNTLEMLSMRPPAVLPIKNAANPIFTLARSYCTDSN
jgi:hypothetical protein